MYSMRSHQGKVQLFWCCDGLIMSRGKSTQSRLIGCLKCALVLTNQYRTQRTTPGEAVTPQKPATSATATTPTTNAPTTNAPTTDAPTTNATTNAPTTNAPTPASSPEKFTAVPDKLYGLSDDSPITIALKYTNGSNVTVVVEDKCPADNIIGEPLPLTNTSNIYTNLNKCSNHCNRDSECTGGLILNMDGGWHCLLIKDTTCGTAVNVGIYGKHNTVYRMEPASTDSDSSGLSDGAIIAIVIGSLIVGAVLIWVCWKQFKGNAVAAQTKYGSAEFGMGIQSLRLAAR